MSFKFPVGRITYCVPVLILTLLWTCVDTAQAQDRRERRRNMVEGLLRVLIESGQESQDALDHGHRGHGQHRPIELVVPQVNVKPTSQMIELRRHVGSLESEADLLINELRGQGATVPQLRPLLADAIQVRAEIDVFGKRCQKFPTIEPVRSEFLTLDHDWRMLNHRLRNVNQLSQQCVACLDKVHGHHQQACQVFGIGPQIDRVRLGQLATEMHADIKHLNRDLYYEFASHPEMQGIVQQGQLVQSQIVQYAPLINRGDYDSIVSAYKGCRKEWRKYSNEVCRLPSERIRHDVARIDELGHQFQEELWITPELDRDYLSSMCSWIDVEMQQILSQITLADLLECKNPAAVLTAAKSFKSRCGTFSKCISDNTPFDSMVPEYRLFEDSWTEMETHCRQLENPKIVNRLDEIQLTVARFQPTFGTGPAISDNLMVQLTSNWVQLADQIHTRAKGFTVGGKGGLDKSVHRELCSHCDKMCRKVKRLNELVAKRQRKKYKAQLDDCFKQWKSVKTNLNKCPVQHRRQVARSRNQVEPLIAKLQLAYSDY